MHDFGIDDKHHAGAVPTGDAADGVTFSQVARLELDELLEQLMERARDVQDAQGRLRGLLRAFLAVARADSLDTVLRHVVEAARELVDARYAALGVVSHGRLTRFVHTGMDTDVVTRIGHLPDGKGLLGLLAEHATTVDVVTRVVQGHPAEVLLHTANGADLLVVGSRGHGTFAGILLGSVSQHCVQHAPCPVVVVPHDEPPR